MLNWLKRLHLAPLSLSLALGLAAAGAAPRAMAYGPSPTTAAPVMAIVSLSRQRVSIYDARGKMLDAPVSTGRAGYETPAGLYRVIERKRHHYSNLYENASMPFMQRITWSGIALHAGALPGYPASHGCIRLPYDFAGRLFELSRRGMRVVVARDDMAPVEARPSGPFQADGTGCEPGPGHEQGSARRAPRASGLRYARHAQVDRRCQGCSRGGRGGESPAGQESVEPGTGGGRRIPGAAGDRRGRQEDGRSDHP